MFFIDNAHNNGGHHAIGAGSASDGLVKIIKSNGSHPTTTILAPSQNGDSHVYVNPTPSGYHQSFGSAPRVSRQDGRRHQDITPITDKKFGRELRGLGELTLSDSAQRYLLTTVMGRNTGLEGLDVQVYGRNGQASHYVVSNGKHGKLSSNQASALFDSDRYKPVAVVAGNGLEAVAAALAGTSSPTAARQDCVDYTCKFDPLEVRVNGGTNTTTLLVRDSSYLVVQDGQTFSLPDKLNVTRYGPKGALPVQLENYSFLAAGSNDKDQSARNHLLVRYLSSGKTLTADQIASLEVGQFYSAIVQPTSEGCSTVLTFYKTDAAGKGPKTPNLIDYLTELKIICQRTCAVDNSALVALTEQIAALRSEVRESRESAPVRAEHHVGPLDLFGKALGVSVGHASGSNEYTVSPPAPTEEVYTHQFSGYSVQVEGGANFKAGPGRIMLEAIGDFLRANGTVAGEKDRLNTDGTRTALADVSGNENYGIDRVTGKAGYAIVLGENADGSGQYLAGLLRISHHRERRDGELHRTFYSTDGTVNAERDYRVDGTITDNALGGGARFRIVHVGDNSSIALEVEAYLAKLSQDDGFRGTQKGVEAQLGIQIGNLLITTHGAYETGQTKTDGNGLYPEPGRKTSERLELGVSGGYQLGPGNLGIDLTRVTDQRQLGPNSAFPTETRDGKFWRIAATYQITK